ncbi:MAG TPA: hypothetical protein VK524_33125, partial [Polyangiaceae bacterium]|nr:hypothetical protein [Polyangiaceae bacterium]
MMRYRTATRVALGGLFASGFAAWGLVACNDEIKDLPISVIQSDGGGTGATGGTGGTGSCKTACCPTEEKCYVSGKEGPGAECLATRDNTGKTKIQLRQTWVYPTTPAGLKTEVIYTALNGSTAWPACQTPTGLAGYIRVMETDEETDISRVGWARYVPPEQADDAIT